MWVGGRKPAAMRRASRYGDVWLPHVYTPEQLSNNLTKINEEAIRQGRAPGSVTGSVFIRAAIDTDAGRAREQVVRFVSEVWKQDFAPLVDRYLLHGTPDRVLARLKDFFDAGADSVVFCPATLLLLHHTVPAHSVAELAQRVGRPPGLLQQLGVTDAEHPGARASEVARTRWRRGGVSIPTVSGELDAVQRTVITSLVTAAGVCSAMSINEPAALGGLADRLPGAAGPTPRPRDGAP